MSISLRSGLAAAILAAVLGFALLSQAQYTVGRVEGTVTDASAAVIGGATVTLRNLGTNVTRSFITDHNGLFVFFALPPGKYELAAEAPRFARRRVELSVLTNQTVTQNLSLAIPEQSTMVRVVGDKPGELNTVESQQSVTQTEFEISRLSSLGHNVMSMVHLEPGVTPTNNPRGGTTFGGGGTYVITLGVQSGLIAANGGRARASSVQLDYTDANDWEGGGFAPGMQAITPDMLQEFKVLTTNFSAEYGLKSNAQVMMVTRSGSNNLHGTAYDFLQNDAFNARDYFDRTGDPTPLKQNIYGFTAGGPVLRDRTFLFTGYEGRRTRGGAFTTLASVPSLSARARATDPAVIDLFRFLPTPTAATRDPDVGTVPVQVPSPIDSYQWVLKGDHHFSPRNSVVARYLQSTANFVARFPSQNSLRGFDVNNHFELRNLSLADTLVLTPRTVNELRFAYGHTSAQGRPQGEDTPRFLISQVVNFGALQSVPSGRIFDVYQVNDQVSHIRGAHVFKFGADIRKISDNSLNATNSRGVFTFTSVDKFVKGQPSQWTQMFGNTGRDFRTGVYGGFVQDDWKLRSTLTLNLGLRWEMQGALGDANNVSSVLDPQATGAIGAAGTGPLGAFRIGGDAVDSNRFNIGPRVGFAWNPHAGNLVVRGGYGIYWDSFTFTALNASRSNPPFNYTFSLSAAQLGPCVTAPCNTLGNLLNGSAPILAKAQGLLGNFGTLTNLGSVTTVDPRLGNPYVQQFSLGFDYRWHTYVVGVGYVGTKGTHLTRLVPVNPVVQRPVPASSTADELARLLTFAGAVAKENGAGNTRLDPRFDQVSYHEDGGSSIYHALQVTLRKSMSHGVQVQASYTWSKSIDDASDYAPTIQANDNSYAQDGSNLGAERAVSNYDIPHRLAITGIWQVPFFKDRRGVVGTILKGWSFESVNMWQSGIPATLLAGPRTLPVLDPMTHAPVLDPVTHLPTTVSITDLNLDGNLIPTGADNTRADCNAAGNGFIFGNAATVPALNQRGVNGAPNTSNFRYTQPLLGHDGSCGRNTQRMNSLTNFDWSVFKDFTLTEQGPLGSGPWNLQIRGELYNVFNTPFLTAQGDAWRTLSSALFGQYNAAGATRRLQLALRLSW